MAKSRFSLEMKDGVQVRSLEELVENFDIEKVIKYFKDGSLHTWLVDRYYIEKAEELLKIKRSSRDLEYRLRNVFQVFEESTGEKNSKSYVFKSSKESVTNWKRNSVCARWTCIDNRKAKSRRIYLISVLKG